MKRSFKQSVEQGFTIGSIILVCGLIVVVYLSARFVSNMNKSNQEQGSNLQAAFNGEEQPLSEEEMRGEDEKDATVEEQTAREEKIKRVNVEVDSLSAALTATLQGTYTGTCYADISLSDGSKYVRFVTPLENAHECTITIPNGKLKDGKIWSFQMGFYTADGKVKGTHPKSTFSL